MSGSRERIVVVGAGGHAKVVIATLIDCGHAVAAVVDDDPARTGDTILGVPVVGPPERLLADEDRRAVAAVGDNEARRLLVERFAFVEWVTAIHPAAYVHPSVRPGPGTVVFAGAVVQPDSRLGDHVIVNTGATVDHDCVLEDFAHAAPGCHLAGQVRIGEGTLLGAGCVVTPGRRVGAWVTVGAGAVVVSNLGDQLTVAGVPARPLEREAV